MCRFLDAELPIIDDDDIQESLVNLSKSVQAELWIGISLYRGVKYFLREFYNASNVSLGRLRIFFGHRTVFGFLSNLYHIADLNTVEIHLLLPFKKK